MKWQLFDWLTLIGILTAAGLSNAADVVPGNVTVDLELVTNRTTVGGSFTPVDMYQPGDGKLYFADITGRVIALSGSTPLVFLNLTTNPNLSFTSNFAGGLLSIAFHPDYLNLGMPGYHKFYTFSSDLKTVGQTSSASTVTPGNTLTGLPDFWSPEMYAPTTSGNPLTNWTNPDAAPTGGNTDFDHFNVIREWTATSDGSAIDTGIAPRVVLRMAHGFQGKGSHNGGSMRFDSNKYMYFVTGDGGGNAGQDHDGGINNGEDGHTNGTGNAQDRTVIYGKVLRIDPLGNNSANGQYGIPATNPYVVDNSNPSFRDEIYAFGFRHAWKINFDDRPGGDGSLYLSDVGQHHREEIDVIVPGGNYGWGYMEGNVRLVSEDSATGAPDPTDLVDGTNGTPIRVPAGGYDNFVSLPPLVDFLTRRQTVGGNLVGDGTAVTGGFVYRGTEIPELYGKYVFGDYSIAGSPPPGLTANRGRLFYIDPILAGDYNDDGRVDAADYVVWRDNAGSNVAIPNDRTSGVVDDTDYLIWKQNFGAVPSTTISEFLYDDGASLMGQLLGFGQDQNGELYALFDNGNVLKIGNAAGPASGSLALVPEPESVRLLIGCGLGALPYFRRQGRVVGGRRSHPGE